MGKNATKETITGRLFNRINYPAQCPVLFDQFVSDRMRQGTWTVEELALTIKNNWLFGMDARYEDVLRDVKTAIGQ